ncbi:MAG: hypothetical protein ACJ746_30770 [Bryobacteraceae bacterium]
MRDLLEIIGSRVCPETYWTGLRRTLAAFLTTAVIFFGAVVVSFATPDIPVRDESGDPVGSQILQKYLEAKGHTPELRGASMEVEISANVPKLQENGKLRALRMISRVGQVTYRVAAFQGPNFVKKEIIARYLQAEQQGQDKENIDITPKNYKFRYKGERQTPAGASAFVFQLQPRKKRVGLYKGELWLDSRLYLPVLEKGRLVKNPSIFFKRVDFERGFSIQDGVPVPSYITSTIDTRLVGKVELNISYSKFNQGDAAQTGTATEVSVHQRSDEQLPDSF